MGKEAQKFNALSHPFRMELVCFISKRGEASVKEMVEARNVTQSCVSQHLAVLRKSDLVETRREKQKIYYSINEDTLLEMKEALEGL